MHFNIKPASKKDYSSLRKIWEASVRATHDFIPEEYIQQIKSELFKYFESVELYSINTEEEIIGFLGVADSKIEMLFIHPGRFGQGAGKQLVQYAFNIAGVNQVDVNEQNTGARHFYEKLGFQVISRSDTDGLGKPYPILHLQC